LRGDRHYPVKSIRITLAETSNHSVMKLSSLLLGVASVFCASLVSVQAAATVGQPAPDFTLTSIDGKVHQLSSFKGKTVVLEWVNPECPFVQKHYRSGNIPKLQQSATSDGVVWLSINTGEPGSQGVFDADRQAKWSTGMKAAPTAYLRDPDGKVGRLYGAKTTPHMYVITPDGTLVYNGAIDSIRSANIDDIARAENYVASALSAVKAGKPVVKSTSQPYGCSVKY
jgi:alkyl hydroperoxide reductase subunit AhpC